MSFFSSKYSNRSYLTQDKILIPCRYEALYNLIPLLISDFISNCFHTLTYLTLATGFLDVLQVCEPCFSLRTFIFLFFFFSLFSFTSVKSLIQFYHFQGSHENCFKLHSFLIYFSLGNL